MLSFLRMVEKGWLGATREIVLDRLKAEVWLWRWRITWRKAWRKKCWRTMIITIDTKIYDRSQLDSLIAEAKLERTVLPITIWKNSMTC
jgi:hypothetical protein